MESFEPFFCIRSFNEFNSAIRRVVELLVNANTVGSSEFVGPSMVAVSAIMEMFDQRVRWGVFFSLWFEFRERGALGTGGWNNVSTQNVGLRQLAAPDSRI